MCMPAWRSRSRSCWRSAARGEGRSGPICGGSTDGQRTTAPGCEALPQARTERRLRLQEIRVGKFNAGQKLNAAFIAGAGLVMLGTGVIMRWYHPWPLTWRTGATFVHDWLALAVGLVIIGHIGMALRDWDALRVMVVGTISRSWAKRHAPAWLDGEDGDAPDARGPPVSAVAGSL